MVGETAGFVIVCVRISNAILAREVMVRVMTEDITAEGKSLGTEGLACM